MKFTKMHGAGNDYVYVDCVNGPVPDHLAELARRVSDRHFGIGSDGLILICPSDRADVRMRMFNADGSEAEMCGNGVRCVAKYAYDHGLTGKQQIDVETGRGVLTLDLDVRNGKMAHARVDMGPPILEATRIPTTWAGERVVDQALGMDPGLLSAIAGQWRTAVGADVAELHDPHVTCVSMGNPHAVTYVDDVAGYPVGLVGPRIETHPRFPNRVNAHFVQVV